MKQEIAIIDHVGYGLRDNPWGVPALWLTATYGPGYAVLFCFTPQETEELIQKHQIYDVFKLVGTQCSILDKGGLVDFIDLIKKEK